MNKSLLIFAGTAFVGVLAVYFMYKKVSNKKTEDPGDTEDGFTPVDEAPVEEWREEAEVEYSNMVDELYNHTEENRGVTHYTPYAISSADFDDESYEDYNRETLTLYSDGVLTYYVTDEVIEDPEDVVGPNALDAFEEEGVDVIYVRDDSNYIQYEITRDSMTYTEAVGAADEDG